VTSLLTYRTARSAAIRPVSTDLVSLTATDLVYIPGYDLTFGVLHGSTPPYLGPLMPVRSLPGRRSLHSTGTNRLLVSPVKGSTVGSRAFPFAGLEHLPGTPCQKT